MREWRAQRGLLNGGLTVVAAQLGLHRETLRRWVLERDADGDAWLGSSLAEPSRVAVLERENKELRRANEISKTAAAFFGAELDRRSQKIRHVDAHRDRFGVEPICRVLQVAPSSYYAAKGRQPCQRQVRDEALKSSAGCTPPTTASTGLARCGDSCTVTVCRWLAARWND